MTAAVLCLLTDPLIRIRSEGHEETASLPGVLARMASDRIETFPSLRPHQRHAWHMFLAQLGALALHRANLKSFPDTEAEWTAMLRALAPECGDLPWCLVVDDPASPAFLQPPVPEGTLAGFRNSVHTPDALDVLITSKNFDLKSAVAADAEPGDWIFALVSLQTMEGFLGAGNYGIARMNGGFSARPFLGLAPKGGMGAHLCRDIASMLASRDDLLETTDYALDGDLALTWLAPWNGARQLSVRELDPWFIEVCRRVRLRAEGTSIVACTAGTAAARIDAKHLNGMTGDFWAPVNSAEGKAFSLDARGFSTRVLTKILFGEGGRADFRLPPALKAVTGDGEMQLVARGVTRGQGKTEGFHERIVPFSGAMLMAIWTDEGRASVGKISDAQQKEVKQIADALRLGCAVIANGGSGEKPGKKEHYGRAEPWLARFEREAESGFFATLWARYDGVEDERLRYLHRLYDAAQSLLKEAADSIPCPSINRPRACARAEAAFHGTLRGPKSVLAADMRRILETSYAV